MNKHKIGAILNLTSVIVNSFVGPFAIAVAFSTGNIFLAMLGCINLFFVWFSYKQFSVCLDKYHESK